MTKKKTDSDIIKGKLAEAFNSRPEDWKRISKNKNADGQWVRAFENKLTGQTVAVSGSNAGDFNISALPDKPAVAGTAPVSLDRQYYFVIWSVDPDECVVDFCTSDKADVVEDSKDTPSWDVLHKIFSKYYGPDRMFNFDFMASENSHFYNAGSAAEAEQMASEISWILEREGFKPMTMRGEVDHTIVPRQPPAP